MTLLREQSARGGGQSGRDSRRGGGSLDVASHRATNTPSPTATDGMFDLFASLSRTAPIPTDPGRAAILARLGLNPGKMSPEELSNAYFRWKRRLFRELREGRSPFERAFRRGRTNDKLEAEEQTNYLLTGALEPRDPHWIEPNDLAMPTRGTLLEIGSLRRSFNLLRIDTPTVIKKAAKAVARKTNEKVFTPAYEYVVPERTRAKIKKLKRYLPIPAARNVVVAAQTREERPRRKDHPVRNGLLVAGVGVSAALLYYYLTKEMILPIEGNIEKAAETFMVSN